MTHPSPTSALIFDMDGTMIDSMRHHSDSWLAFCTAHGVQIDQGEMMRRTTGRNGPECVRILLNQPGLSDAACWPLVHEKEALYRATFGPVFKAVPGIHAFTERAHALGLKLAVGTAGDVDNVAFALAHLTLRSPLSAIVRGDEGLPGKPDPAIFLEASNRMSTAEMACIVFEDAPFGIEAARRAGMRAVAICTTHSAAELAGPHVLAAVADFNALLESNFLETLNVEPV
jgi:beta-phosphoglucomutase-like phosphatase (HAD superfamily)